MHFDRLKPYVGRDVHDQNDAADNHLPAAQQTSSRDDNSHSATTVQQPVGQPTIADELLDDDDEQPTDNDVQDEDGSAPCLIHVATRPGTAVFQSGTDHTFNTERRE